MLLFLVYSFIILNVGDVIYVYGLRIVLYNGLVSINNPDSRVIIDNTLVEKIFENHKDFCFSSKIFDF